MDLFNNETSTEDQTYTNIRDSNEPVDISCKKLAEKLWDRFKEYADANFLDQIKRDFHARFWEMDLACCLLEFNFELEKKDNVKGGPDVKIIVNNDPIWIEAIAPTNGKYDLPDSVKGLQDGYVELAERFMDMPDDRITLRYTAAIDEKLKKYIHYVENSIIQKNEPYIVAINGGRITNAKLDFGPPRIVRSVFAIGDEFLIVDSENEPIEHGYKFKGTVSKCNGIQIRTDIFWDTKYSGISALIYSNSSCCNRNESVGSDYVIIHNPMAINPIKHGTISIGTEYIPILDIDENWHLEKVIHNRK